MEKENIIKAIADALTTDPFDLAERDSVESFVGIADRAGFLKMKTNEDTSGLIMADHFALEADLFIYDDKLGALGLVQVLDRRKIGTKISKKKVFEEVKQWVEKATYAAYLLRNDPKAKDKASITVHLVMVTPNATKLEAFTGAALQEVARETECLQHISAHSLTADPDETWPDARSFKTAFCWLLRATGEWFTSFTHDTGNPLDSDQRTKLSKLALDNYRLPGRRELCLESQASVHFIHGHNGTGKSTIAEALELCITGKVARLGSEQNYDEIIRNKYAKEPATVEVDLTCHDKKTEEPLVVEKPATEQSKPPYGASFRLNNTVMQRLTHSSEYERSRAFAEAFFPDLWDKVLAYDKAEKQASGAFDLLPESIRTRIEKGIKPKEHLSEAVVRNLKWLDENPSYNLREQDKNDLIPFHLQDLKPLSPALKSALEKWASSTLTTADLSLVLTSLDEALVPIITGQGVRLEKAAEIFKTKLRHFQIRGTGGGTERFEEQLNKGLELRALSKIAESVFTATAALDNAAAAGWRMNDPDVDSVFGKHADQYPDPERLKLLSEKWTEKSEAILGRLRTRVEEVTDETAPSEKTVERIVLTGREIRSLNSVGPYLLYDLDESDEHQAESFGKIVNRAITMNIEQQIGRHNVGKARWHENFEKRLGNLIAALKNLSDANGVVDDASPCRQHYLRFMSVLETHRKLQTDGESIAAAFEKKIGGGPLYEAIHELMAFFAPAGWTFLPIKLQLGAVVIDSDDEKKEENEVTETDGSDELGGGAPRPESEIATLRLNTAELNLFAVALFFLCAYQVKNPHRLLILDDPLQNMDEVTVITLARGIGKLIRLWFKDWQILFLFHSENDLVRFSKNIPSAVYRLPWLSPSKTAPTGDVKIPVDLTTLTSGRQRLSGILRAAK